MNKLILLLCITFLTGCCCVGGTDKEDSLKTVLSNQWSGRLNYYHDDPRFTAYQGSGAVLGSALPLYKPMIFEMNTPKGKRFVAKVIEGNSYWYICYITEGGGWRAQGSHPAFYYKTEQEAKDAVGEYLYRWGRFDTAVNGEIVVVEIPVYKSKETYSGDGIYIGPDGVSTGKREHSIEYTPVGPKEKK